MNIDFYERIWMWMAGVIVVLLMSFVGASTFGQGLKARRLVDDILSRLGTSPRRK
jgi:hypothetical protein